MLDAKGYIYWGLAGCFLGFGLLAVFSIGLPFFLVGILLVLYRVKRAGGRGFWLTLIGMGLVPTVYMLANYLFTDRSTILFPDNYLRAVLVFMLPAVIGVIWGMVETSLARTRLHHK